MSALRPPLVFVLALSLPRTAGAEPSSLRFTTVFEESRDGIVRAQSSAETEAVSKLLAGGLLLVDEAQSRKIRSVTGAGALLAGGIPPVITSLDADRVVAAVCRLSRIKSDILGSSIVRYSATLDARVIAVDSARVVASLSAAGEGIGYDAEQAASAAGRSAGAALAQQILKLDPGPARRRFELSVSGIPGPSAAERLVHGLERMREVSNVTVLQAGREASKIAIESSVLRARDLAVAIDRAQDLGLSVESYSEQSIRAEWSLSRAARLALAISAFRQSSGEKRYAWQGPALGDMVATALARSGLVSPASPQPVLREDPKSWAVSLSSIGLDLSRALVLAGSYRPTAAAVDVDVKLLAPATGALFAASHKRCASDDLSSCAEEIAGALSRALSAQLKSRGDELLTTAAARDHTSSDKRPLSITNALIPNLFPARLPSYGAHAVGRIELTSSAKHTLKDLVLTAHLPGFMTAPISTPLGDLGAGAIREVPITLVLDKDALVAHDENRPAVVTIDVDYGLGESRLRSSRNVAVVVYDRNALSWKEPGSVASFVTPHAPDVQSLSRGSSRAIPASRAQHPFALAVALFRGLAARDIRYVADPLSPFGADPLDYVQYPEETLVRGSGDCDDIAVLYAALGEAVGAPMLLVTTPGHVLVAAPTGVPPHNAELVASRREQMLEHAGQLWIPIETTKIGQPFEVAWRAASAELERWRGSSGRVQVIDLRDAWKRFPPVSLVPAARVQIVEKAASVRPEQIEGDLASLDASREEGLRRTLAALDQNKVKLRTTGVRAMLLARLGRADEAEEIIEASLSRGRSDAALLNDLANLRIAAGRIDEARALYKEAFTTAGPDLEVPIRLNRAIAALVAGDEADFGEQIAACLEKGAEDRVRALSGRALEGQTATGAEDAPLVWQLHWLP